MKKLAILLAFLTLTTFNCSSDDDSNELSIFEEYECSYVVLKDPINESVLWNGNMSRFLTSEFYVSGETYLFDIYVGESCGDICRCSNYQLVGTFIETIE